MQTESTTITRRQQAGAQCNAVVQMATTLAQVYAAKAKLLRDAPLHFDSAIVELIGRDSARLMEDLGNALDGMDAVGSPEDAWIHPVFERAHEMFPIGG